MIKKENKSKITKISIGLVTLGVVLSVLGSLETKRETIQEINKHTALINEIESHFTKATKQTQEKEKLTTEKTAILTSFNKALSKKSNLWNFIFYMKVNDYKTAYIYGVAKNEEAKQQLLSILSNIPNLHVIYEDIQIKDDHKWKFPENEFPPFDKEKDVINPNVKIIPYSENDSVNGNTDEAFIKSEYEKDEKALRELDKTLFDDPLLYKEITDIKTNVTEKVAEVSGIVSSQAHKDRIKSILDDFKSKDLIFSYADKTIVKDSYAKSNIRNAEQDHIEYLNQLISKIETSGNLSDEASNELKKFHESLIEYKKSTEEQIKDNEKIQELENLSNDEIFKAIDDEIKELQENLSGDEKKQ